LIDKQKWRIPTKHIKKPYIRNIILLFYCTATHKYQYGKSFKFVTDTIEMVVIVRKLGLQLQSNLYIATIEENSEKGRIRQGVFI
jgi:hypothetical protein